MIEPLSKLAPPADDLEGVPEAFRPVAAAHGRALYEFVMNAQLAGEAAERLAATAHSAEAKHAVYFLTRAFNANANELAEAKGWTETEMVACRTAIEVAFATAAEAPRIVLNS